jgi:hypothetical protein
MMVGLTKTRWFIIVDGDEVYPKKAFKKLVKKLKEINDSVCRIKIWRRDFIDVGLVGRKSYVGKIFRTKKIRFVGIYPFEKPVVSDKKRTNIEKFSVNLSKEISLFHFRDLKRSSNQDKMVRYWRKPGFPIYLYFGEYPETVKLPRNIFSILAKFFFFNLVGFYFYMMRKFSKLLSFNT